MNALLSPVGPKTASVYWRRRLAVLAAVVVALLVLFLVVRLLTGGGNGAPTASAEPGTTPAAAGTPAPDPNASQQPTPSAGQTPTPTASPADSTPCDAKAVQLSATADASSYAAGQQPRLGVLIRNVGTVACTLDAGSKAVELTVVSGTDRVWSSDDCQRDPTSKVQTLTPGAELASTVSWSVQRSAPGCPADLPTPGAGTYQLTGRVGDLTSQPLAFSLG